MRLIIGICVFLALANGSFAHEQNDKDECAEVKQKIREIQSRMRAGYTRAQGERMEAQLRKLRVIRAKTCR